MDFKHLDAATALHIDYDGCVYAVSDKGEPLATAEDIARIEKMIIELMKKLEG